MEQVSRIGMDTSKHVFQLHGVNASDEVVLRRKLRRKEMGAFFEKLAPTVIAIEACGALNRPGFPGGHLGWVMRPRLAPRFARSSALLPRQGVCFQSARASGGC